MDDLVIFLQKSCINEKNSLTHLLRHAQLIAAKLGIDDFQKWIISELNGYKPNDTIPDYRRTKGKLYGFDPHGGWKPMIFPEEEFEEQVSTTYNIQSIAEIEDLLIRSNGEGELTHPLSGADEIILGQAIGAQVQMKRVMSKTDLTKILNAVKNIVLSWSIALEKEGIQGNGFDFSSDEKSIAQESNSTHISYQIENVHSFIGNATNSEINQNFNINITKNNFEELSEFLSKQGISKNDLSRLSSALDEDPCPSQLNKFGEKVSTWIGSLLKKAASGAWNVTLKVGGDILAKAINQYYGLL
jgi:hypothetical protein